MLDIGWMEMLLVAMVALVVIGPKDLPRALRTAGQWVGKVKGVAREFQNSMDDMIRESELEEIRQDAKKLARGDLDDMTGFDNSIDPTGGHKGPFAEETSLDARRPRTAPPASEMLHSHAPTDGDAEADLASDPTIDPDPAGLEVAGERPSPPESESERTGT